MSFLLCCTNARLLALISPPDSFGMVAYEVVHQRKPFDDVLDVAAAVKNLDAIPPFRPLIQTELPQLVKATMTNCWRPSPGARWTIQQVQAQLQQGDMGGLGKATML